MEKKNPFFDKSWWKDFLVAILATTVSIILTFGTASLIDRIKQKKERKLTALMVISSIESFARQLDETEETLAVVDSVTASILWLPVDDVMRIRATEPGATAINESIETMLYGCPLIHHDKTAETIFSSQMETWKTIGNFRFIEAVGICFSRINGIEEEYNSQVKACDEAINDIYRNRDNYPGDSMSEKYLLDMPLRALLVERHYQRAWLKNNASALRQRNKEIMRLIGITEKEVIDFIEARGTEMGDGEDEIEVSESDFSTPYPTADSLALHFPLARQLDSLLRTTQ